MIKLLKKWFRINYREVMWNIFFIFLIALLICGILLLIPANSKITTVKIPLVALSDRSEISGKFFAGTGNITTGTWYDVITLENGFMKRERLYFTDWAIKEDDTEAPQLYYEIKTTYNVFGWDSSFPTKQNETIIIPTGTVIKNFVIDLQ